MGEKEEERMGCVMIGEREIGVREYKNKGEQKDVRMGDGSVGGREHGRMDNEDINKGG